MSSQLAAQLEVDGYDGATARELVKLADQKTDDVAREFLADILGESAAINRYLASRGHSRPLSVLERERPHQVRAETPSRRLNSPSAPSAPSAPSSSSSTPVARSPVRYRTPEVASRQPSSSSGRSRGPDPYKIPLLGSNVPRQPQNEVKPTRKKDKEFTTQYKVDTIHDLDAAIKKLDLESSNRSPCTCRGSIHGLLELAPNCLQCGKIVCNKEGLGDCLSCGAPLIENGSVEQIRQILEEQRDGIISSMGKRALQAAGIDPSLAKRDRTLKSMSDANSNLERLLHFQETGATRARIIDQAADFETTGSGTSIWASPSEQAQQLREQERRERKLEEMKRIRSGRGKKVVSIDIRGNKVYQTVQDVPEESSEEEHESEPEPEEKEQNEEPDTYYDPSKFENKYAVPLLPLKPDASIKGAKEFKGKSLSTTSKVAPYDEEQLFAA